MRRREYRTLPTRCDSTEQPTVRCRNVSHAQCPGRRRPRPGSDAPRLRRVWNVSPGHQRQGVAFRILHNTWISQYPRKKRRPAEVSVEWVSDLNAVALRTSTRPHLVEETALELMTDGEVAAAMMALQPTIRTAIYYADVLGFTCREIAAITGSPRARSCHGFIEGVSGCVQRCSRWQPGTALCLSRTRSKPREDRPAASFWRSDRVSAWPQPAASPGSERVGTGDPRPL